MKTFINLDKATMNDLFDRHSGRYPEETPYTNIKSNIKLWKSNKKDEPPTISIIILTKDNLPYLRACLSSIERFTNRDDVEVIIVSNCEEEATKDYLDRSGYMVYYNAEPFSFASYNNFGVKKASGKYLVFLNDDTLVTKDWLEAPIRIMKRDESIGVCGCKVLNSNNTLQHMGIALNQPGEFFVNHMFAGENPDIPQANENRFVKAVSGVCMFVKRYVFDLVGGFSEDYVVGYFEDLDLCLRVEENSEYKVLYVSDSVIYHFGSITFNKENILQQSFHKSHDVFRNKWTDEVENSSYLFTSKSSLYGASNKKVIIRNSNMFTAGGGEFLTMSLANALKEDYDVEIQCLNLAEGALDRIRRFFKIGFAEIDFELLDDSKSCDIFINLDFGSNYTHRNSNYSVYYTMFPHQCGSKNYFLSAYDKVAAISNYSSQYVWDYWKRRAKTIYPCINHVGYSKGTKKEPIILSVGRFFRSEHQKNQDILLKAFKALKNTNYKLILAGSLLNRPEDLDYIKELRQFIAINSLNAEIKTNISHSELLKLYKSASIYWHGTGCKGKDPITKEHFGISIGEAMSAGCIPVVYNEGGVTEIIAGVGEEWAWNNIDELLDKTNRAINIGTSVKSNKIRTDLSDKIHQYSFETFKEEWLSFLKQSFPI